MTTLYILLAGATVAFVWLCIVAGPDTAIRMIYYNDTHINDYKLFPSRPLTASPAPYHFKGNPDESRIPTEFMHGGTKVKLEEFVRANQTVAFLVIKDETILYERYFREYERQSLVQAFSMSKSFMSALIGCAIDERLIGSEEQPVTDFIPELKANGFDRVTLRHLLNMTSGTNYRQGGLNEINPFGLHPRFEYTPRLESEILKLKVQDEPGSQFEYKSGDTAILSLALKRALKTKTITAYLQEKIWTPLGMESNAVYTLDHEGDGLEKTWCCLAATARDFAKFGQLYLNRGMWQGKRILSEEWIKRSTPFGFAERGWISSLPGYKYHWWILGNGNFLGAGKAGQLLYINPSRNFLCVRLGRRSGSPGLWGWTTLFNYLAEQSK
jgi:CubicO group peptidase (beta-lactamase class C family)